MPTARRLASRTLRLAVLLGAAVAVGVLLTNAGPRTGAALPALTAWIEGLGPWAPLAFVLAYAAAVVALLPGSLLTIAAGALFGVAAGSLYAFTGATLGACCSFFIARHLARARVEQHLVARPRFRLVDRLVGEQGGKVVMLLRLAPLFPFNLLNYALGLTRVRFVPYLLASVGMLPWTLLYVYSGHLAGDLVSAAAAPAPPAEGRALLWTVGLLAALGGAAWLAGLARKALAQEPAGADDDLGASEG